MVFDCAECRQQAEAVGGDWQEVHILRCGVDPAHWLTSHAHIYNQEEQDIPFQLWRWQERALGDFERHRRIVAVKTRGIGLTWLVAGYLVWKTGIKGLRAVVASRTEDVAVDLMERAQYIRRSVEDVWPLAIKAKNSRRCEYVLGGVMLSETASPNMGSGYHPSLYILDEWAKLPEDKLVTASVIPAVGDRGQFIGFSSPRGYGNQFHQYYEGASSGVNGFHALRLHWREVGEGDERWQVIYDDAWYQRQCAALNNDTAMIAEELDCDFMQSGSPVFARDDVDWVFSYAPRRGISNNQPRDPEGDEQLIVSIDPASGEARGVPDSTSLDVVDGRGDQIYHEHWAKPPNEARARLLAYLGRLMRDGAKVTVVLERNALGIMYATWLRGGPWTLIEVVTREGTAERPPDAGFVIRGRELVAPRWWWEVGKARLVVGLQTDTSMHVYLAYDMTLRGQMLALSRSGVDKFSVPVGIHDDCLMSFCLARWAYKKGWAQDIRERRMQATAVESSKDTALFDDIER